VHVTVGSLLREATDALRASGSETARLDAELLLAHVLGVGRAGVLAAPEAPAGPGQAASFREFVDRRIRGEPVAYIRGLKEFYGLALSVDPRALIPRPETELLVELGMARVTEALTTGARPVDAPPLTCWDVGTGSGAIAVALAVECRRRRYGQDVRIVATDASADALSLAVENAVAHGVADVTEFGVSDLVDAPPGAAAAGTDVLLANLPYIPSAIVPELPVAASYEPVAALDGGPDGLEVIRRLLGELDQALRPAGIALLEIGDGQAEPVGEYIATTLPGWTHTFHADLAGTPRVVALRRTA
jgi:release factor glutamine methyltransferase